MRGEYDLVIIGGSSTARYAAGIAVQQGNRVALVEPPSIKIQPFSWGEIYQAYQNRNITPAFDRILTPDRGEPGNNAAAFLHYSQMATKFLPPEFDLAGLSQSGVDVIVGRGEFQKLPQLTFVVEKRFLRSHRYLLAPELISVLPEIPGLEESGYTIPAELGDKLAKELASNLEVNLEPLAQSWIVMGNPYRAAEMSQILRHLGKNVTLVSPKVRLFPYEDRDANALLQGEIEAAGIRLLTHSPVTLIRYLEGRSWVQAGDRAIEAENILLCPRQIPQMAGLNLSTAGVQINRHGIVVNKYLQTTNPQIYACSDQQSYGAYEVAIALKNALIWRIFPVNYHHQPQITHTQPPLARIGMTELEAEQGYGKRVMTFREYIKDQPLAQMGGETTGFCQLIVHRNGQILGGTIVGRQAPALISIVALAMESGLNVGDLAQLPETNGSLLQRTAAQYLRKRSRFYYIWQEIKGRKFIPNLKKGETLF